MPCRLAAKLFLAFLVTALAAGATPDPQAQQLKQQRKFAAARQRLLQVIQANTGTTRTQAARYHAAHCLYQMKEDAGFQKEIRAFLADYPAGLPHLLESAKINLALSLTRQRQWSEARDYFKKYVADHPKSKRVVDAEFQAAACLFDHQDYEGFRRETESLLIRHPDAKQASTARLDLARSWQRQGRLPEAREAFLNLAAVLPADPKAGQARAMAAQCLFQLKQYDAYQKEAGGLLREPPPGAGTEDLQLLRLHLALTACRKEQWREAADQTLALLGDKPAVARVRLCALLTHARACLNLAARGGGTADRKAAAELERRAQGMLGQLRGAAQEVLEKKSENTSDSLAIRNLLLEGHYYAKDYQALAAEAGKAQAASVPGTRPWAMARFWEGVARMNQSPPDQAGAVKAFTGLLDSEYQDPNREENLPTDAAYWLAFIAQQRGDRAEVRRLEGWVRERMPEGRSKQALLERFAAPAAGGK